MDPVNFDYKGARNAGLSDEAIAAFLSEQSGYRFEEALAANVDPREIISWHLRGGAPPYEGDFTNLTVNRFATGAIRLPGQLASGAAATMRAIEDPVIDKQPTEQEYYEAGIPVSTITNKPMATFVPRKKESPAHYEIDKEAFGGGRWTNIDKATGSPGVLNNIISAVTKEQLPTRQDVQAFYDDVKAKTSDLPDPESAKRAYQYLLANEGETAATEYRNLFKQKLMEALPPEEHKDSATLKFLDHLANGLTESGERFIYEHPSIDMPREVASIHGAKDAWKQGKFMKWAVANSAENLPQMVANIGVVAASSLFGSPVLGAVMSSGMMYALESGGVYQDLIKQGVPPKYAADVTPIVGGINAALELAPVATLVNFGSGSIIKKLMGKKLTKYLVENPTFTKKLIDKTLGIGFQALEEEETEGWQERVSNAAKAVYNENQDLFAGVTEARVIGLFMGLFGATGETVHSTWKERGAAGKVEDGGDRLNDIPVPPPTALGKAGQKSAEDIIINVPDNPKTNEKDTSLLPVGSPDRKDQSYIGDIPAVVNPMSSGSPNREDQSQLGNIIAPGNEVPSTDWREELRKVREGDEADTTGTDEGQTKGGEENLTPEQKMREELISGNFDPDFIENKVKDAGSLEAVHNIYPDDSTLVRAYARRFAENLYGKGENKDVKAEENKPAAGQEKEAGAQAEEAKHDTVEEAISPDKPTPEETSDDLAKSKGPDEEDVEKKEKIDQAMNEPWSLTPDNFVSIVADTLGIPPDKRPRSGTGTYEEAWRRDHRLAVEQAVKDGKLVPAEVLAEYPDLPPTATEEGKQGAEAGRKQTEAENKPETGPEKAGGVAPKTNQERADALWDKNYPAMEEKYGKEHLATANKGRISNALEMLDSAKSVDDIVQAEKNLREAVPAEGREAQIEKDSMIDDFIFEALGKMSDEDIVAKFTDRVKRLHAQGGHLEELFLKRRDTGRYQDTFMAEADKRGLVDGDKKTLSLENKATGEAIQENGATERDGAEEEQQGLPGGEEITAQEPTLTISELSEKSIIVKGDTKTHKDRIKALGDALWDKKHQGWIFSKKHREKVQSLVNEINGEQGETPAETPATLETPFQEGMTPFEKFKHDLENKGTARTPSGKDYKVISTDNGFAYTETEDGARVTKGGAARNKWSLQTARDKVIEAVKAEFERLESDNQNDNGMSLFEARNALTELRAKADKQGNIADDRLLSQIVQFEKLVKELEAEEKAAAENPHGLVVPIENIPADMKVMTSVVGEESGRQATGPVKAREAVEALGDLIEKLKKVLDCVKS